MQELIRLRRASLSAASLTDATPSRASTPPAPDTTTDNPITSEGPLGTQEVIPSAGDTPAAAPSALSPLSAQPGAAAPRAPRLKPKPGAAHPPAGGGAGPQATPAGRLPPMPRSRSATVLRRGSDTPELEAEVARALEDGLVSMADVHVYGKRTPWQGAHTSTPPCVRPAPHAPLPVAHACRSPCRHMLYVMNTACVAVVAGDWELRYRTARSVTYHVIPHPPQGAPDGPVCSGRSLVSFCGVPGEFADGRRGTGSCRCCSAAWYRERAMASRHALTSFRTRHIVTTCTMPVAALHVAAGLVIHDRGRAHHPPTSSEA